MIKRHKGLITYSLLNILDKALIFLIPIIILFLFNDKELYNKIEYIYALASIIVIFLDFGIKNYIFYNFKEKKDKAYLLKENRIFINFLLYFYSISTLLFIVVNELFFSNLDLYLYVFIFVRSLYSILISFYSYYFRLIDRPSKIYIYSLTVSLLTIGLVIVFYFIDSTINLFNLFVFQILLIILAIFIFRKLLYIFSFKKFSVYIKESLSYSYPIIINLILITIINQFGKVYAYNFMSTDDMTTLAFIQRFTLIILLIHGSLSGYFSKKLFMKNSMKVHLNIFLLYSFMLILIGLIIVIIGYISNTSKLITYYIDLNLLGLLVISTLMWCFTAYGELYFNRKNENKFIPMITLVGFVTFSAILWLNTITITTIAYAMLFSNVSSLIYSIILLKQKRILVL